MNRGVKINMNNNNALITVAMLSALLTNQRKDYLDIITPFVLNELPYCGETIITTDLQNKMKTEYGFEDIPVHIINRILDRVSRSEKELIKKIRGQEYVVISEYNNEKFKQQHREIKDKINSVTKALQRYLDDNAAGRDIDSKCAEIYIVEFLETYGYSVSNCIDNLKALTYKRDQINYYVARFIIDENEKDTDTFKDILEIIKGFFVYKAIYYFSSEQKKTVESKLKGTEIYFDTILLVYALGYNREEDKKATRELIDLINNNGGKVKAFSQHVDEAKGILKKYAMDPECRSKLSLNYFYENHYDAANVLRHRDLIEQNLEKIGISVEEPLRYENISSNSDFDERYLDESKLTQQLEQRMRYTYKESRDNDVRAISDICRKRKGQYLKHIENCKAVMVTPNSKLVSVVSDLYYERFKTGEVKFIIREIDLTSMLWLKTFDGNSELPKLKLLETAYAACEPSKALLDAFERNISMLEKEEKISMEDALLMRTQNYVTTDLISRTQNDPSVIDDALVLKIRDNYASNLSVQKNKEIENLKKENIEQKSKAYKLAKQNADDDKEKYTKNCDRFTKSIVGIITSVLLISNVVLYLKGATNLVVIIASILIILIGSYSILETMGKFKTVIYNMIKRNAQKKWDDTYEIEIQKVNKIFE